MPSRQTAGHRQGRPCRPAGGLLCAGLLALAACGGGGGGGGAATGNVGSGGGTGGAATSWTPGVFQPASSFQDRCASPRAGAFPDRQGTARDENNWLRSWSNDLYLWYDEIVDRDPAQYATPAYFDLLKTTAQTASGQDKDRFHFTLPTDEWEALSQSGITAGYGASWAVLQPTPPREILVAFTEPGQPATQPGIELRRGARVLQVDGVDAIGDNTQSGVDVLNAGLFPSEPGQSHTFVVQDPDAGTSRTLTMTSVASTSTPVQNVGTIDTPSGPVGYLLFNDHIATAEQQLIDAVNTLNGVADLILDIRYNGGGFLAIASEVAYMIAGPTRTSGRSFERLRFNDKHPNVDPVTDQPLEPLPFIDITTGSFSAIAGQPLPTLDLARVFVLTGAGTCSASESIINGLSGIGVEVIQIGAGTCGKPFGFYPADNCGTTYFSIQFQGVNDQGFGDYPDGFSPSNAVNAPGVTLAGCAVADDFNRALGDPLEARLAAALAYRDNGTCPTPSAFASQGAELRSTGIRHAGEDAAVRPLRPGLPGKIL